VHAVLADVPFDADATLVGRVADQHGRMLGASREDIAASAAVAQSVLRHELLGRAAAAERHGKCRREAPVTLLSSGGMVEGIVDLAFEEDGRWIVVDYKTDREVASQGEAMYRRQVAAYGVGIENATGLPAEPFLLLL
jgi:ATP-dependent helicase/nuclease subunit A